MNELNLLNETESFIKTWLETDSDVDASYVHEKIVQDLRSYSKAQLPAIAVHAVSLNNNDDNVVISGVMEVVTAGNFTEADTECKKLASQVFKSLQKDRVGAISKQSNFLEFKATSAAINPIEMKQGFFCTGEIAFEATYMQLI